MINVTKSFLPPFEEYTAYLKGVWETAHLTNHGPLVTSLEARLKEYFNVPHFYFLNNGTIALQIALKALDIKGEVITTPFSYVATTSSIVWENAHPVFADIDPVTFTIDASKIEAAITPRTSAILATHVYGVPCDTEAIDAIAKKYNLKVIYDAAHAFGVQYKGKNLLNYGDISTLSFHATKLFHTVEGGGIIAGDSEVAHRISYLRNFGHNGQEAFWGLGINGKSSEIHAAMGLCVLPYLDEIISKRKAISELYDEIFLESGVSLQRPQIPEGTVYNYGYYVVFMKSEEQLLNVRDALNAEGIYPRRYFYPSLNQLPYINSTAHVPVSEDAACRALCLPLYHDLPHDAVEKICSVIARQVKKGNAVLL